MAAATHPGVAIWHILNKTARGPSHVYGKGRLKFVMKTINWKINNCPCPFLSILLAVTKEMSLSSGYQGRSNLQFRVHLPKHSSSKHINEQSSYNRKIKR